MTLTANRDVDKYIDQELREFPVKAAAKVYKGALMGDNLGYARPLVAGDPFIGIAYEESDNTSGSDGDTKVRVRTIGDFDHALAGAAQTNLGDPVFASADDTLTFTGTSNTFVGMVIGFVSAGNIILRIKTERDPAATIADPTGGATIDAEARTAINAILVELESNGFTKSS